MLVLNATKKFKSRISTGADNHFTKAPSLLLLESLMCSSWAMNAVTKGCLMIDVLTRIQREE